MAAFDLHSLEGLARDMNGTTDYFAVGPLDLTLNPGANDFGVCGFVRLDTITAPACLAGKYGAAGNKSWVLYLDVSGSDIFPVFGTSVDGTAMVLVNPGVDLMNTVTWAFIAAWYDKSDGKVYVQVNNSTIYEQAGAGDANAACTAALTIGATGDAGAYPLDGRWAKLGYWIGSYPTIAQRTQLYNSGKGLTYYALPDALKTNLREWFDGDEISGNIIGAFAGEIGTAAGTPGTGAGPDAVDALAVAHPAKPEPNIGRVLLGSVASQKTTGQKVYSTQERAPDLVRYTTYWPVTTDAHVTSMDAWFARYKGNLEPYYLELPSGARLRCRCPQGSLPSPYSPAGWRSIGPVEHVEDIL